MKRSRHLLRSLGQSKAETRLVEDNKKSGEKGESGYSSCSCLLGRHSNKVSPGGGAMSLRRRPIRSQCSKRCREDHSRQVGQRERSGFVRLHTCDVQDDMSAILQVIPSFSVSVFILFCF